MRNGFGIVLWIAIGLVVVLIGYLVYLLWTR